MCWLFGLNPYIIMGTGERSARFVFPTHRLWQNPVEHPRLDSVSLMTLMSKKIGCSQSSEFCVIHAMILQGSGFEHERHLLWKAKLLHGSGHSVRWLFFGDAANNMEASGYCSFPEMMYLPTDPVNDWMNMEYVYPFSCTNKGKWIFSEFVRHMMFTVYI